MEEYLNIWVTDAVPMDRKTLRLTFNDGSVRVFDCMPLIDRFPVFKALEDESLFQNIELDGWTVTWNEGNIDIAPEYLYEHSVKPYDNDGAPLDVAAETAE